MTGHSKGYRRTKNRRQGYVLLMTLAVIMICAVLLVGLAQLSLTHVTTAKMLERDIQSKWGAASCSRIALSEHSRLLYREFWDAETAQWAGQPLRISSNVVQLGDQVFRLDLIDESSKLDINFLLNQVSEQEAEQVVSSFVGSETPIDLRLLSKLRDLKEDPIESWGQVFVFDEFYWPGATVIRSTTNDLTCWSKRLNYHTCSDEVLFNVCKPLVGSATATRLQRARRDSPGSPLKEVLQQLNLVARHNNALRRVLVERSQSQGIWIEIKAGERTETIFHVQETIVDGVQRVHSFSW